MRRPSRLISDVATDGVTQERFESITILSTVKNIMETAAEWLNSLVTQSYPGRVEIVVVDGGSTDGTRQLLQEYSARFRQLKVASLPSTQPQALNHAMDTGLVSGELVALIDGDCVAPAAWLQTLVETMHEKHVDAVGGPGLTPPNAGTLRRVVGLDLDARFLTTPEGLVRRHPNMDMLVKANVLRELRFSDELPVGYDADFTYRLNRAGYLLWYSPRAAVLHYHRATLKSYMRQQILNAQYALSLPHQAKRFPASDNIVSSTMLLEPIVGVLAIASTPFALISSYLALVSGVLVTSLFALFALDVGKTLRVRREAAALLLFPLYTVRVFAWIVGAIRYASGAEPHA